jgi:hypothetical protein
VPQFQADHEACGVQRSQHRIRIGEVGGFDTADEQRAEAPVRRRGKNAADVTPSGRR